MNTFINSPAFIAKDQTTINMSDPQGPKATEIECKDDSATSSQTPTNDQGPDNQEAPVEELPIRIEQPNDAYLVRMPSEVILSITDHMDRQSLRSLALTSARLYHTVSNAFYRSFNYETYRQALEAGDFAQIERCIKHNAAPSNVIWTKENAKPQFPFFRARRDLLPHLDHKPINYLDFAFHEGKMTADQCLFVLQRLVENGGDIATTWTDFNHELEPEQLCNELLDPLGWKPIYDGEVSDIWEAKLNLLDRYKGIDSFERRHLVSILTSLRKVEDRIRAQGVSVLRRNAKACLVELTAMLPSYSEESDIPTDSLGNFPQTRIHSFSLRVRDDVDSWWYRYMRY
ncbi:hypothetical protein CDV31_015824 [Fusarium ambrosium]|uniref:F-box domain-containing protein n=1 Tax=Fusarium ambrosium TaxID=131363 RepID=A0A428SIV1_9HYPO|nr:hypothetical protein CDV31_015824 [Fusarium ambrosium]